MKPLEFGLDPPCPKSSQHSEIKHPSFLLCQYLCPWQIMRLTAPCTQPFELFDLKALQPLSQRRRGNAISPAERPCIPGAPEKPHPRYTRANIPFHEVGPHTSLENLTPQELAANLEVKEALKK